MTERELQDAVIEMAHLFGWLVHHDRPARTENGWRTAIQGDKGFPDLVLARNGEVLFIELKSDRGKNRPEQMVWATHLRDVVFWRPAEWRDGTIERALRRE